jgi:hypothetical protein
MKKNVVAVAARVLSMANVAMMKSVTRYFADGRVSQKTKDYEYRNLPWLRALVANDEGKKSVSLSVRPSGANPVGKSIADRIIAEEDKRDDLMRMWERDKLDRIAASFKDNTHV